MATFGFFTDASLATPLPSLSFLAASDLSTGAVSASAYFGSPNMGMKALDQGSPGYAQITLSVNSSGAGQPIDTVSVALTSSDLGAGHRAIDLGPVVLGGAGNAVRVWVSFDLAGGATNVGTYSNLSLVFANGLLETAA